MAYIVFHDLFISFLKHWSYLADLKDFWESTRIDMKVVKSYKCWRNNLADLLIKIVGISLAFSCSNSFIISSISKLYVSNILTVLSYYWKYWITPGVNSLHRLLSKSTKR